ncbi:Hypothetical predicted protein, partial [Paramuricea clavata]
MADVESVSSSVVREYLSRKGLKETLSMLDKEMPRTDNCVSNRAQLAKELHINTLMKKNKESQESFRTMLEVIVQFMMTKTWQEKHSQNLTSAESVKTSRSSSARDDGQDTAKSCEKTDYRNISASQRETDKTERSERKQNIKNRVTSPVSRTSLDDKMKSSDEHLLVLDSVKKQGTDLSSQLERSKMSSTSKLKERHLSVSKDETTLASVPAKQCNQELTEGFSGKINEDDNILSKSLPVKKRTSLNDPSLIKSSNVKKGLRRNVSNVSGGVMSTGLRSSGKHERRNYTNEGFREKPKYFEDDLKESSVFPGRKSLDNLSTDEEMAGKQELFSGKTTRNVKDDFREKSKYSVEVVKESSDFHGRRSLEKMREPLSVNKKEENVVQDWKTEILQKKDVRKNMSSPQSKATKNEDLTFEDIDETLDDELQKINFNASPRKSTIPLFQCQPITLKQAKDLKTIVFGSTVNSFNSEWRNQGFTFCHLDHLKYGIVQHKGGPCGLLASVQAVVLKQLLFNDRVSTNKQRLNFSSQETNDALCSALVEILWRAGSYKTARVAVRSEKDQFIPSGGYKVDRLSEKLVIYETNDCNELEIFIKENMKQFACDDAGCILLLYSAILSRTVEKIKEDMDDDNGTLMGAHGYCTQDMVNLLLTGKAISNTFDDVIELDSGGDTKNILKGVDKQSDIGLLSLFEHYKSCL